MYLFFFCRNNLKTEKECRFFRRLSKKRDSELLDFHSFHYLFLDNIWMPCYFNAIKKTYQEKSNGHFESYDKCILVAQQLYNLRV